MSKRGALPDTIMKGMIAAKHILNGKEENVGPCSYDLTLDNEIYRISGIIKPRDGESVQELINRHHTSRHYIAQPLEVGVAYLARVKERLHLPEGVYAYGNTKSTAGRLFVKVRLVADRVKAFDTVQPAGYVGELWLLITPHAFPLILSEGDRLLQLRFFNGDTRLDGLKMSLLMEEHKLIRSRKGHLYTAAQLGVMENEGACALTLDLENDPVGWECIKPPLPLNYSKSGAYRKEDFFRPVHVQSKGEYLRMQKGSRLILSTHELVRVPPFLACEMRPFDERVADFRAHGAGFIDPGWGWGERGLSNGRPLTLEVEPYEDDIIIQRGEVIAKIRFEHLSEEPESHYDLGAPSYGDQMVARLAKQFK